ATLALVLISAAAAWPVYEFGEEGYDRVLSMTDDDGHAWLDEHQRRAELLIYFFYALAGLSAVAIAIPIKWPTTSTSLVITTILLLAACPLTLLHSPGGGRNLLKSPHAT